jgi:hypothetical protein
MKMNKVRKAVSLLGISLVMLAALATVNPQILPQNLFPQLGTFQGAAVVILLIVVFGLYGLSSFRISSVEESDLEIKLNTEPETVEDDSADLKIQFSWSDREEGRADMRDTVGEILMQHRNYTAEEATEAVKTGGWTDDKVAAAFIHKGLKYPLFERLREWLEEEEETFERRIGRTVESIEELYEEVDS